jgi:hypothetical protein
MTYTQAYTHIDNLLDKAGTAYFTDDEKDEFLDLAVLEYTKNIINTLEKDSESMHAIAPLVVKSQLLSQTEGLVTLPVATEAASPVPQLYDVYHILRAYTATNNYSVNIMTYNEYSSSKNDPFHMPDLKNPVGLLKGGKLEIIGNTEDVYIEYIACPYLHDKGGWGYTDEAFSSSTNLGGYGVDSGVEIVNIAVRKMMLSLEDPRYQLQNNELSAEKR